MKFEIRLRGRTAHVSRLKERSTSAGRRGDRAAIRVEALREHADPRLPGPASSWASCWRAPARATWPDEASIRGDVRTVAPGMDRVTAAPNLRRLVESLAPPTSGLRAHHF